MAPALFCNREMAIEIYHLYICIVIIHMVIVTQYRNIAEIIEVMNLSINKILLLYHIRHQSLSLLR